MNNIRWNHVRLIFSREVRDQLRDRRTMFMIAVLPLLLYPLMGMSFLQLAQFLKKHPSTVLLVTEAALPTSPPLLDGSHPADLPDTEALLLSVNVRQEELPTAKKAATQAAALIDQGTYDMVVCFPRGFIERLQLPPAVRGEDVDVTEAEPLLYYNAAKDRSRIAHERMSYVLHQWRRKMAPVEQEGVATQPVNTTLAFRLNTQDVAKPMGRQAAMWSKILPFVALIWALTGAFYPAVDICAGEKERGTLETLLSSPAERAEIVVGKLLTVMLFSFTTALLNLLCMTFTATFAMSQFEGLMANQSSLLMGAPPLAAVLWLIVALVPIVALFSALALALATMARSTREGQYYLMPLLLITMPLMLLAMFPSAELDLGSSIIPITGVMLLLRQLMEGEYEAAMLFALPVITVTVGCGWMAIRWAVDQFNNENVLFRESERFEIGLWLRQMFRDRAPTPSPAEGIMCGLLILMVRFFAALSLPLPSDWSSFAILTVVTLVAFVATPALLMAIVLTTQPRDTLLLDRPQVWLTVPAAALLAVCLHPVATALNVVVRVLYPIDAAAFAPLQNLFTQAPSLWQLILLLAIVPAICEELAFRGFILSGLRHIGNRWRAIFITSMLFGLAHGVVQQSITAIVFGMVLGYLAVKTRSLIPCIVFHAVHNALGLCSSQWMSQYAAGDLTLDGIFQTVHDTATGTDLYHYSSPILLAAFAASAVVLHWFRDLPSLPSDEERLQTAIDQQRMHTAPSL